MFRFILVTLLLVSFLPLAFAEVVPANSAKDACGSHDCTKCHSLSTEDAAKLLPFPDAKVKSIKPAPSHGLYEVLVEGDGEAGIVYIDYGKKNLIMGRVINLKTMKPVMAHSEKDFPKPKSPELDVKNIPVQYAFVIGNTKGTKNIYVFTDPDCPFCRTFHPELHKLAKLMPDLRINIMLYPIAQLHPQSYDKARVIISGRAVELLDKAFEGKELPAPKGDEGKADIDAVISYAQKNGVNATPMMFLPDGKQYQGPRNPESMKKAIEGK